MACRTTQDGNVSQGNNKERFAEMGGPRNRHIPAGSFKWDKLVKSSEASKTGGFIKGGRLLSSAFPSRAASVVVVVIFYKED